MAKYLLKRILHGLISVIIVVGIVMVLIYSCLDKQLVFAQDPTFNQLGNNQKIVYQYRKWQEYGYIYYVTYAEWVQSLAASGEIDQETASSVVSIGRKASSDSEKVAEYVARFTGDMESKGYTVMRLDAKMASAKKVASGGQQQLFAFRDRPLATRLWSYLTGLISIDNIHYVKEDIGERGLTFTLHDPVYGGKFAPAIMGNGTLHKYLLYTDDRFPFIHQNLVTINLGKSYTVNQGVDVFQSMNAPQGSYVSSPVVYPSGFEEVSADDLHSATYVPGSRDGNIVNRERFTDDYTSVITKKNGLSQIGYSFVIGICAVCLAYLLGVPLGILMSRHKDRLLDKIGTIYIVFIIAVPSLAYIFLFKAIGYAMGLPTTFNMDDSGNVIMYILPVVSLALPSIANLMKWLRRYMIDQMNSDYVKFARSGGLSEREIFTGHILKNAIIPLVHGIPASVLGALVGAIITERVYVVPGAGNLLTRAINMYDNGVIVGVTLFYAILSVVSIILGDVLMSMVDPRISFTEKAR